MAWIRMVLVSSWALGLTGCSFIDDFDFEIADGAVAADAGVQDGAPPADGGDPDGAVPADCTDPCLSDAVDDFGETQGAGPLAWRYLNDTREPTGLQYGELALSMYLEGPAWTDGSPPPAIVDCRGSGAAACAARELLFEANRPGDGSDPVLAFTAPEDGTYAVVVDVLSVDGLASLKVSRLSRLDTVIDEEVSGPVTVTAVLDLFAGERGLVTVAPAADPGGAVSVGASVRVSRVVGVPAFADCELAIRFPTEDPFEVGCTSSALTDFGRSASAPGDGPSDAHGSGRLFDEDVASRVTGHRMDYGGDFTVQLWARVDRINFFSTAIYADWSAFVPEDAGGVSLGLDPRNEDSTLENIVTAGYLFPLPFTGAPDDPSISCDEDSCSGSIVASLPDFGEWHFYRIVRRADRDEVRLCIDGALVGTGFLDGATDISNPSDPKLGSFGPLDPTFQGAVDDVRVFSRALPCGD